MWDVFTGECLWTIKLSNEPRTICWGYDYGREERMNAFAMGFHSRLGDTSILGGLEKELFKLISTFVDDV